MSIEELKQELLGKTYPEKIVFGKHATVVDINKFLNTQFTSCANWTKEIDKCPSYLRLISFHEIIKSQ
ncbi:DUF6965 family protein [Sphingobacterium sp. HJSM2_6]|uniref:DUF6965 family protein n=1 Tax=Sphingobacterium sp. HJSM2_6 TaxID=3366264 RepID=UPI003BE9A11A